MNNTTPASRRISMGGAMLFQESPSFGRHNILTPTRTLASKDNRRLTQTPSTLVNRAILYDEGKFPHQGKQATC